ncbi:hypothetical protein D3C80_809320 [compost metagenome]
MVSAITGNNLFLLRQTTQVVVVPNQLGLGFVGVGARQAVKHLTHLARGHFYQPIGQPRQLVGGVRGIGMVVRELVCLAGDGFGYLGAAVADVHAIQAGEAVDVLTAGRVCDGDAFAGLDDCWVSQFPGSEVLQVGERVQYRATILGRNEVDLLLVHGCSPVI